MNCELVLTDHDGKEERLRLDPENIVDIQDALKYAAELGSEDKETDRYIGPFGVCLMQTKRKMDKVIVPSFDY